METRIERLKTLFAASTVTPLPRRPGIHLQDPRSISPAIAAYALGKSGQEIRLDS